MKRVSIILDDLLKPMSDYNKVVDMHDEAQWEIPDDELAKQIFKDSVHTAFNKANEFFNLRCPQEPDVKFGHSWAETH